MNAEDMDTVRAIFAAFNDEDLERLLALTDPDFEVQVPAELSAEPDVYRGHEGMRRYWESFKEVMYEIRFHADRMWDTDEGVLAALRVTARGRETGIPVEQRMAAIWKIRDGRCLRVRVFSSLAAARRAATGE